MGSGDALWSAKTSTFPSVSQLAISTENSKFELSFAQASQKLLVSAATTTFPSPYSEAATSIIEQIEKLGRAAIFERADVTDYQEIKQAVDDALARLGRIDILVASGAATGSMKPDFFRNTPPDSYMIYAESQWFSRLYCVRAVLDHMIEKQDGKIIVITTDAGRWPTPAECLAGGAGAAMVMSTKVLAHELARWRIKVNAIALPPIPDTPSCKVVTQLSSSLAHVFDRAIAKQPFRVTVEDVAKAALFLASDESSVITGQIISVNGGLSFPG